MNHDNNLVRTLFGWITLPLMLVVMIVLLVVWTAFIFIWWLGLQAGKWLFTRKPPMLTDVVDPKDLNE